MLFRKIKGEIRKEGKAIVLHCAMLAILYFVYNVMFIYVWKNFDPLTGSYTISTTVVLMPLLLFLIRKKIGVKMLIITPFVAYFYPGTDYIRFAVIVLCNTAIFPIALGVPITVLIQEEFGFRPVRLRERA